MREVTGIKEIIKPENLAYKRSSVLTDNVFSYCPGCGHGTAHRILAEVIEEAGLQSETIGIAPVGCSVLMYDFMDVDMQQAAHGRAPAVATAVKRLMPEKFVFTYQGVPLRQFMHATGEKIS
jgi:2-oxoglutarate ferredoxin oxidoreductase subunit beta